MFPSFRNLIERQILNAQAEGKLRGLAGDDRPLTDPAERKAAMARIADLDMRHNMARDARRSFFR
ncbi:hypothetical protein SAMN05444007_106139 [Cribrihabitans marinus]|uniref:DUF1992 domain-containing protein n=1 Tax=Cribrihabitans marinus TaxID=1227549 RepID=A0A1H7AQV0_9RHOB|nr:hypothetical protein [Cribrihabitans marinus]GGH32352.1 hypothetical protein GCM10010973_23760 [Cribrihabitans marinus]SEJ67959.1 hypothetical protein SAMN05444007_106139 [Cribrihabitans marinus]